MKPSFILIHAECINQSRDSIGHLILVSVVDGVRQSTIDFILNPEAPFEVMVSGMTRQEISDAPKFVDRWEEIEFLLSSSPVIVSSAEGYAAHALYDTLVRLNIPFKPMEYINAKAICRRGMNHVSYSLNYLSVEYFDNFILDSETIKIAECWADLAIKALEGSPYHDLKDFAKASHIRLGAIVQDGFKASLCVQNCSNRNNKKFDSSSVDIDVDPENPFYGMNVVFTGKMESMTREEARSAVVAIGGVAPDRLTKDTNFLVVGKQDLRVVGEKGLSGKMKKAAEYKDKGCEIEVIDESDFIEMLGEANIYKKPAPEPRPSFDECLENLNKAFNDKLNSMTDEELRQEIEKMNEFRKSKGLSPLE